MVVAREHPLADRDHVTVEAIADYAVADMRWVFPSEVCEEFVPLSTPRGRPIRRVPLQMGISGLSTFIALGEIVHPTVASFARHFGDPHIVAIPLRGLAPIRSALLWRDGVVDPRVRAFVEVARKVLMTSDTRLAPGATGTGIEVRVPG